MKFILTYAAILMIANLTILGATDFDIDGDGKADPAIYRVSDQEWWYTSSTGGAGGVDKFGGFQGSTPVVGDYTGDGKTDFVYTNEGVQDLTWNVLRSDNTGYYSFPFGLANDLPIVGDFDGDGIADPTVMRGPNYIWFSLLSSTGEVRVTQFGAEGDYPMVNDYDGDGISDIAIYRFQDSEWWIQQSRDGLAVYKFGTLTQAFYGLSPADLTGDGAAELIFMLFNPGTSAVEWFVSPSENRSTFYSFEYGIVGDYPALADYDGDGKSDITMYRPDTGAWYINQSRDGFKVVNFGGEEDIPIQSFGLRD